MSGFPILDLVVGIIFIYFLLSIICSSAVELWLSIIKTRAKLMEQWLRRIFDSQALDSSGIPMVNKNGKPVSIGEEIMNHCMVTALAPAGKSPSYISAGNFVSALLDKITIKPAASRGEIQAPPKDLTDYITAIQSSTVISGQLKRTILILANEAREAADVLKNIPQASNIAVNVSNEIKSDLDHFRERLEKWYDTNADRLSGTLKRTKALPRTVLLASIITVALNVDSIEVSRYLYDHPEQSKELANKAASTYENYRGRVEQIRNSNNGVLSDSAQQDLQQLQSNQAQFKQDLDSLKALELPIGWSKKTSTDWKSHIAGWLATILAICLGAPFWFDILNKIANLRSSGPKPVVNSDGDKK